MNKKVWTVKADSFLLGVFDNEQAAWKMNSICRYVMGTGQFSTSVEEIEILGEVPEYWQTRYNDKKDKENERIEAERKAWNNLIEPIKHTLFPGQAENDFNAMKNKKHDKWSVLFRLKTNYMKSSKKEDKIK